MSKSLTTDGMDALCSALRDPDNFDFSYGDAVEAFAKNVEALRPILLDDNPTIQRRALYIFGELGKAGMVFLDDALRFANHPHPMARNSLMDGVMSYSSAVNPRQARIILSLVEDPKPLVREKVVTFIGAARREVLEAAIDLFDDPVRLAYREALKAFDRKPSEAQAMFDEGLAEITIQSAFTLGAIERLARTGRLTTPPQRKTDDYLAIGVESNTERLIRRAKRRDQN